MNKRFFYSLVILFWFFEGNGQVHILRYNDNFSALKYDSSKKGWQKLKYIPIGSNSFVSFGGEVREHYQYFNNQNFGERPPGTKKTDVGQLWHRVMVHSNIEAGRKTRIFLQLNSTFRFFNPNPPIPEIDENQLSFHQYFIDYALTKKWMFRVGRQELNYGNALVIGMREFPNTRLTFDAVTLNYHSEWHKIDFIAATPVISRQKVFDDRSFKDALFGLYGAAKVIKEIALDYYLLYFKTNQRKYTYISGEDKRYILGLRLFSKSQKINYDVECNYQTGAFSGLDISAYRVEAEVNYKIFKKYDVIAGAGGKYITGDKDPEDKKLNSYNMVFSKPPFGLAPPIGATNIKSVHSSIQFTPIQRTSVNGSVFFIWRQSSHDGIYSPASEQILPARTNVAASKSKTIGTQYVLELNYLLHNNIGIAADAVWLKAADFLKATSKGENLTYVSCKATFKF